jgi:hypothetical protein
MSLIISGTDGLSDVDGSAATPAIRGTDANTGIFFPAADTIAFAEGGVESMRIASGAISGPVIATQANQETATSTTTIVTPGRQQFHPSAAKAWIQCNNNGAIAGSYNVASIADTGTGVVTVTLTTAFSSTNYSAIGSNDCGGGGLFAGASITSASVYRLLSMNTVTQSAQDSGIYFSVAFGDQ